MDDSAVQTAICVIGHPIAGNPSQFCTLRALAAMGIEWQCLSFDVPPESLPAAIAGIDVLKFAGALIAAPHQRAVAALIASPAGDAAAHSPALPDWIDGLERGEQGQWAGCNFLGDAFAQALQTHEQKIGQPLRHCVYLGDAESFETLIVPYHQHLPPSRFVLGITGLEPWPAAKVTGLTPPADGSGDASDASSAAPPAAPGGDEGPSAQSPDAADDEQGAGETAAGQPPDPAPDPLRDPILLIRQPPDPSAKKASKAKPNPLWESIIESTLEQLHPDSLQMHLTPVDSSWPATGGAAAAGPPANGSAVVSPLDLEILRVAAAIRRWTGREADRDVLAEAIEEYLEV